MHCETTTKAIAEAQKFAAEGKWVAVRTVLGLNIDELRAKAPDQIVDLIETSDRHLAAMGIGGSVDGPIIWLNSAAL